MLRLTPDLRRHAIRYAYFPTKIGDGELMEEAAERGFLAKVKWLRAHGCPSNQNATYWAARNGHGDCLKYLLLDENRRLLLWSSETVRAAAEGGQLACLRWLYEEGCPRQNTRGEYEAACGAACFGHMDCLRFAREQGDPIGRMEVRAAAHNGRIPILEYLFANGCKPFADATRCAAEGQHLACLKYLREKGCPWSPSAPLAAMNHKNRECFQYMYEEGCPYDLVATYRGYGFHGPPETFPSHRKFTDILAAWGAPLRFGGTSNLTTEQIVAYYQ